MGDISLEGCFGGWDFGWDGIWGMGREIYCKNSIEVKAQEQF